jgi:hypothetical protein
VRDAGGTLHNCATVADVKNALDELDGNAGSTAGAPVNVEAFSWDARSAALEAVFEQVLN